MKRKLFCVLLCAAMVSSLLAGCGGGGGSSSAAPATPASSASGDGGSAAPATDGGSGGKTYAIVTKAAGNPFNEKVAEGFQKVIEEQGGTCIVRHPEAATADAQVSVIQSLISQGVNSICIAANDENALQAALEEARDEGINICCVDSKVNKDSRQTFVNQAGVNEIGQCLMEAVYDISGGEGDWAILSATSQATNQNAWIEAM